jgi:cobalamin synthase
MLAVLGPLLSLLGLEAASLTTTVKRQAIVWGLIGALGVIFVTLLLIAANTALSYAVGPVIAPLILAVIAAVIAIGIFLVAHLQDAAEARRKAEKEKSAEVTALVTTALLTAVPLILRSPLLKQVGIPAGAMLASALLLRKRDGRHHD